MPLVLPRRLVTSATWRFERYRLGRRYQRLQGTLNVSPRDVQLLFAAPRGGSTWLSEVLSRIPGSAPLIEPLHLHHATFAKDLNQGWHPSPPSPEEAPRVKAAFQRLFKGDVLDVWTCHDTTPEDLVAAERLLIKFCRASALLPWITETFPLRYKPVYLVRHPLAVVASQFRHGSWDKLAIAKAGTKPPSPDDIVEHQVTLWCNANAPALQHPNSISWIPVHYEDLLLNPLREFDRIFDTWGCQPDGDLEALIRKPSGATHDASHLSTPEAQLAKWQGTFSEEALDLAQQILDRAGVTAYSARSPMPIR